MRHAPFVARLAVFTVFAACSPDAPALGGGSADVDSAGVRIVTNTLPTDRGEPLGLPTEPALSIGEFEGAPEYQFFDIRAVRRLADGRIAVANAGSHEVRFFGPDGTYLGATGGEGEGPGEFRSMWALEVTSDSIIVWDRRLMRVSVLDLEGRFARTFQLEPASEMAFPDLRGALASGDVIASSSIMQSAAPDDGIVQNDGSLLRYSATGSPTDTISTIAFAGTLIRRLGGPQDGFAMETAPLMVGSQWATLGDDILVAHGSRFEIRRFDSVGQLKGLIRVSGEPLPVVEEVWEAAIDETVSEYRDAAWAADTRAAFERARPPEFVPAVSQLLANDGLVFARRTVMPGSRTTEWWVFDESGLWRAAFTTPKDLTVSQIGLDFVLGTVRDELDVERVVLYDLDLSSIDR